jgi:hypothetical protein
MRPDSTEDVDRPRNNQNELQRTCGPPRSSSQNQIPKVRTFVTQEHGSGEDERLAARLASLEQEVGEQGERAASWLRPAQEQDCADAEPDCNRASVSSGPEREAGCPSTPGTSHRGSIIQPARKE